MATPLVNSLPSSLLSWKTPYEVLYGHPPNYTSLRCLSCLCFATNIKAHKDKFSPRASKCVFLGFQPSMKAYKVYDLLSHIVFHSMDVVLLKLFFPSLPPSLCCLLPPLIFSLFLFLMSCSHPLPHALFLFLLQDALFFFLLPLLLQLLLIFSPLHPLFLLPLSLLFLLAPTWLRDFVTNHSFVPLPMPSYCSIVPPSSPYTPPIFPYVFSSHFSSSYLGFLGQVSSFMSPLLTPRLVFILNGVMLCTKSCRPLIPITPVTSFHFPLTRNRLVVVGFSKPSFLYMALLIVTRHVLLPRGIIRLRGLIILIVSPLWLNQSQLTYL